MTKSLLVAGTHSGCGKTSLTLGLLAALTRRGLRCAPFKSGPDFIDPGLHRLACGVASHNLDTWMLSQEANREIFARHARGADVAVVEGAMGLFDGASGSDETGSAAHLAKLLGVPAVLVADASGMARSAAALAKGYFGFDPDLRLAGVVFNRVGGPGHREILAEALAQAGVPLLGMLSKAPELAVPSRHLGLVTAEDLDARPDWTGRLADWVEAGIDLDALLARLPDHPGVQGEAGGAGQCERGCGGGEDEDHPRAQGVYPGVDTGASAAAATFGQTCGTDPAGMTGAPDDTNPELSSSTAVAGYKRPVRLGLARDRAFCFVYGENLRLLEAAGARIVPFSPLSDSSLPEGLDGLYLPGGYPELNAQALSGNGGMLADIRRFCRSGAPVYAECGGFMYLMESVTDLEGRSWPMAGVFPCAARMGGRFAALGYREARFTGDCLLGPAGTVARGHEFHYSSLDSQPDGCTVYQLEGRKGRLDSPEGFVAGNTLGSYVHLHFASNPTLAGAFVSAMARFRESRP